MSNPNHFPSVDDFSSLSDAFMHWLKSNPGVRVNPKIKIADLRFQGSGRGVVACDEIAEDEELFAIPHNLILSVQNSSLKSHLDLAESDLDPWLSLILVMVYEYLQSGASRWASYFSVLPTSFDTLMFWTEGELRELQGSAVVNKIGRKDADESILNGLLPLISKNPHLFRLPSAVSSYESPEGRQALLALAHRMGSLIMAYAFDVEKGEDDEEEGQDGYVTDDEQQMLPKGMVPLADILNADGERNNARLFQEDGYFVMKAIKSVHTGEELFNDYGEIPRADLLRRYGYVTDNYAQYDVVEIPLQTICRVAGLGSIEPGPDQPQLEFLDDLGVLDDGYSIPRIPRSTPLVESLPDELLIVLQTLSLSTDQLNHFRSRNKAPKPTLSAEQASFLAEVVRQRCRDYSTDIGEDERFLAALTASGSETADQPSQRRRKMAIQVRKGEKEILTQLLTSIEEYVAQGTKRTAEDAPNGVEKRRKV
ncbi:hypothetical protein AJ80_08612 [Polytolypa hystricis UAMH7299]|uniref:SET domain-containing protein n=1 Tax=Polytolypa hystricis (strain UAMH7299) TaxID=1447883 RepID=A0A2B7X4X4_POLH7|nr:hypothetical protein AJ80_08612 [Polytolypa hystricis UAMH7299]